MHKSNLISTDIDAYLVGHEHKQLLRLLTCGSVDDGKSTLIGRLLHDSKLVYDDQLESIKVASVRSELGTFDLSLLVDGLQAEREQGITIDVAYRYFSTAKRKFIIADTPGHEQYTRNMVTGATTCDLAIILIDACYGIQQQTRRHSVISSLLGIKQVIVAVNKMDLKDFNEDVFEAIKKDYLAFADSLKMTNIQFIPISALHGDNVVNRSDNMPWYIGNSLMDTLEQVDIATTYSYQDLRFPVQYVNRPNSDFRGFCGTIISGVMNKGDKVIVLPCGKISSIQSIVTYNAELDQAYAPMAITVTLADKIDISRGDMLVQVGNLPQIQERFLATVVWMAEQPMLPNTQYAIKHTNKDVKGCISSLRHKIDVNTLMEIPASSLQLNEIGLCEITLQQSIFFDAYDINRGTGSFIIIDLVSNVTVGAGMITSAITHTQDSDEMTQSYFPVTKQEKATRYAQKPVTVLFIGPSGSGKTTIAYALDRRLFNLDKISAVVDSADMGLGLNHSLAQDQQDHIARLRQGSHVVKKINSAGIICCAALAMPEQTSLTQAISVIGENDCFIVYLDAPLSVCKKRDPNGLYANEEKNNAVDQLNPFWFDEPPHNIHLVLPTAEYSVATCVEKVMKMLADYKIL